jgi:hypothetical protein
MKYSSGTRVAVLSFVVITLLFVHPVAGQEKKRIIPFPEWASSYEENEEIQLELVEIKVAGKPIILGQPFDADENWLKDMTLRVRNISNKPIIVFGVGGGLLEAADEELPPYASPKYGIGWHWGKGIDPEKKQSTGAVLKPGEIVELSYLNVGRLTRNVLAKEGEGAFCKLTFMAPGIQYADGRVAPMPRMRFYGNGKP